MKLLSSLLAFLIEITVLGLIYYRALLFIETTRGKQVLKGLLLILVLFLIAQVFNLEVMHWLLTKLLTISILAFIVIFQPELRRGLARLGEYSPFTLVVGEEKVIDEIVKASYTLAKRNVGALIAIQRQVSLDPFIESGVPLDSTISAELLVAIFTPYNPLHDGGVVIESSKIKTASCLFPLTQAQNLPKSIGTRHRSAIGLSEETDAVIVIVSEETGDVSLALRGELYQGLSAEELGSKLLALCSRKITKEEEEKIASSDEVNKNN